MSGSLLAALAPLYGLIECIDAPLSLWRKHAINYSWREDFATRVQEGIDRDEVTMNAVAQHARAWARRRSRELASQRVVEADPARRFRISSRSFRRETRSSWPTMVTGRADQIAGRTPVPFLDRGGVYWGPPTDDADAILELHRQRERGLRFFAVAFPTLWYLDYYRGLRDWLRTHAREHVPQ